MVMTTGISMQASTKMGPMMLGVTWCEDHAPGLGPEDLFGFDEGAVADGDRLGAGDAAEMRNEDDADQQHDIAEAWAENRDQRQRQDDTRKEVTISKMPTTKRSMVRGASAAPTPRATPVVSEMAMTESEMPSATRAP